MSGPFTPSGGSDLRPAMRFDRPAEWPRVKRLFDVSFGRDIESRLVEALREKRSGLFVIVAEIEAGFVGAAAFTPVAVAGERDLMAAALGPMATAPKFRGRGVGAALVRAGVAQCRRRGVEAVFVLGAPSFYGRFGFTAAAAAKVAAPWAGSHFQALSLVDGVELLEGEARYPEPFVALFGGEEDGA